MAGNVADQRQWLGAHVIVNRGRAGRVPVLLGLLVVLLSSILQAAPADAVVQGIKWDPDGTAEISAPPLSLTLKLAHIDSPREITQEQTLRLFVRAVLAEGTCAADVRLTPTLDGRPISGTSWFFTETTDVVAVQIPLKNSGSYALSIEGAVLTYPTYCGLGPEVSTPYAVNMELFTLNEDLPGPASRTGVSITSSGPHTLVANTWSKSRPIRITFTITDPERRNDLVHSICMTDTSDCWFEDAKLVKKSYIRKTSTGWVRTWDFWWKRTSPNDCVSNYWEQPDVSVILVVSNSDGKTIGRKKHTIHLTCRL